jgi:hypothetical protein
MAEDMSDTTIMLRRKIATAAFTLGVLTVGGTGIRYAVVEDAVRPLSECTQTTCVGKIDGKTAIPAGRYEIRDTYSLHFKRNTLELIGVPGFQGIRVHSGNTADDTEGCLILGLKATSNGVAESRIAMVQFNKEVREDLKHGLVFINIEDAK